jgi:hypothetical protein
MAELMSPGDAASALEKALGGLKKGDAITIADAAARSGLALRDAEVGLHTLSTKYRGTLSATDKGELLFKFPYGFSLPLTKQPWLKRAWTKLKNGVLGIGKVVVRAWISIVMVAYALIFLVVGIALATRDERGGVMVAAILRMIFEALFWTFHPWSPIAVAREERRYRRHYEQEEKKAPFYQRVNRFVFGPDDEQQDPKAIEKNLIAQIRASKGRIGIGDVLRVTGLPREEADPLMARLMLDYEGDVKVSDDGGIFYEFPKLRLTAEERETSAPRAIWNEQVKAKPTTGNDAGSNWLIALLNGFNLVMSLVALETNLTIDRIIHIFQTWNVWPPVAPLPYDGIPLVLGVIPFVFSALLFALPVWRWATEARRKKTAAEENAKRQVLKTVIESTQQGEPVSEGKLKGAWQTATGEEPDLETLRRQVVELGGDVDLESGKYVFRDLEAEVKALAAERKNAPEEEKKVGEVIFAA